MISADSHWIGYASIFGYVECTWDADPIRTRETTRSVGTRRRAAGVGPRARITDDGIHYGGITQRDQEFEKILADTEREQHGRGERAPDAEKLRGDEERHTDEYDRIDRLTRRGRTDVSEPERAAVGVLAEAMEDENVPVLAHEIGE